MSQRESVIDINCPYYAHEDDRNSQQKDDLTTNLTSACKDGKYEELQRLLSDPSALPMDICQEDASGMTALEFANKKKHFHCAALITGEALFRSSFRDHPFRRQLRAELNLNQWTPHHISFDEELFRRAAENEPEEAKKYLDNFTKLEGIKYKFSNMDKIFGEKSVKTSALASILNDCIVPSQKDDKLKLLQHPVLMRVLDIKWELFASRVYYTHLLWYILMLMAMTNVVVSLRDTETLIQHYYSWGSNMGIWLQPSFVTGVFAIVFFIFGNYYLRYLEPDRFIELTRWMASHETQKYRGNGEFPHINIYKAKARSWLFYRTLFLTLLVVIPFLCIVQFYLPQSNLDGVFYIIIAHSGLTFIVLWICAAYFLLLEMRELLGEDPWIYKKINNATIVDKIFWTIILPFLPIATVFMPSFRKYYASWTNLTQVLTYFVILVPFAILHIIRIWTLVNCNDCNGMIDSVTKNIDKQSLLLPSTLNHIYFFLGALSAISLWILSLQFFEVHKTAGYLLPILFDVFMDAWNYLIFYGVFQCGLTCAFYFICKNSDKYSTLWSSFCSTYFVMFGETGVDDINQLNDDVLVKLAIVLRMFHNAIMVVVLLNLLLATMNKTVDRNWDNLQARALTSYARAIFRIEAMLAHDEIDRKKLLNLGNNLHPIFTEEVFYHDLTHHKFSSDAQEDTTAMSKKEPELMKLYKLEMDMKNMDTSVEDKVEEIKANIKNKLQQIQWEARQRRNYNSVLNTM